MPTWDQEYPIIPDGFWHPLKPWGWEYQCLHDANAVVPLTQQLCSARSFIDIVPVQDLPYLCWRTRKAGDRVSSRTETGFRKLKDLFIDRKIPRAQRQSWPLLTNREKIWWGSRFVEIRTRRYYGRESIDKSPAK